MIENSKMYLLDTDVLIWILRGNQPLTQKIFEFSEESTLALSVISIAEVYKNIFPAELPKKSLSFLKNQHWHYPLSQLRRFIKIFFLLS